MIFTIIILVAALAFTAFKVVAGIRQIDSSAYGEKGQADRATGKSKITNGIIIGVIGLAVAFIQPFALEKIDSGHSGIIVNLAGSSRGVDSYQYTTGWVVYNTWFKQVLEFPTFQQHIEYDDQLVVTKGGFSANIKPSFNYSLKEDAIGDMFQNLRLGVKEIEQGWLKNAIIGAVNDEANRWEVDSIFNHRQAFEAAIVTECNKRLTKWFNVSQLRTNITPPESLQEAIIAKTKSIQQAEAEEQRAIAAESTKRRKIAEAQADSAETIINASAAAKAIQLKQEKITPMYIEYLKATAWDGKLPSTIAGGSGTFLNIK
jgi:regulator of protease activity HflC (stomatin/prohibitin superfamily)